MTLAAGTRLGPYDRRSLGAAGLRLVRRTGDRLAQRGSTARLTRRPALAPAARASSLDYLGRLRAPRVGTYDRRSLGAPGLRLVRRTGDRLAQRGSTARLTRRPALSPAARASSLDYLGRLRAPRVGKRAS